MKFSEGLLHVLVCVGGTHPAACRPCGDGRLPFLLREPLVLECLSQECMSTDCINPPS